MPKIREDLVEKLIGKYKDILTAKEYTSLVKYSISGGTLEETGAIIGCTRENVRKNIEKAIKKIEYEKAKQNLKKEAREEEDRYKREICTKLILILDSAKIVDSEELKKRLEEQERPIIPRFLYVLNTNVYDFKLSKRTCSALKHIGIKTLGDLVQKTEGEMLQMPNFGKKSLDELTKILINHTLYFGMDYKKFLHDNIPYTSIKDVKELVLEYSFVRSKKLMETDINFFRLYEGMQTSLKAKNISTLADLVQKTESDMLVLSYFGKLRLTNLKGFLNEFGLCLNSTVEKKENYYVVIPKNTNTHAL